MPCPHNEITIVQRSQRQSAVAAAAYQSGEKLFCEYDQQVKHYPEKRGIQNLKGWIILEAHDLTKEYRHTVALDHIDLKIEKGKIYGFIGQNGAGKTTFLRLVTGLAFPTSGTLSLWGKTVEKELQEQRKRIGCMIETPALFPTMTAYPHLCVDEYMKRCLEIRLIQAIVKD